jgi:hypothetical protein
MLVECTFLGFKSDQVVREFAAKVEMTDSQNRRAREMVTVLMIREIE